MDESDEADYEDDAAADTDVVGGMSGMVLIQRELGGQIIKEIDNT
jgi:DNA polymerase-3 subunit gamma/tau